MDGPGHELLARARLASQKDGRLRPCRTRDLLQKAGESLVLADERRLILPAGARRRARIGEHEPAQPQLEIGLGPRAGQVIVEP